MKKDLKIHFFTIVLNGMPFIKKHIETLNNLKIQWHWHIIEGVADLKNDTAWSIANGGKIDDSLHNLGRSNDGTTEYLDEIKNKFPNQISIYRKPAGEFWNGKIEMVNAPLASIKEESLLWQIDVDEFWTEEQIHAAHDLFSQNPEKFSAYYWCEYFVGPNLAISSRNGYANNPIQEWERTWRFLPHFRWISHEPPTLAERTFSGQLKAVRNREIIPHAETEKTGLVFQHFAYVYEHQLEFKEKYYGYKNALHNWRRLQTSSSFPIKLGDFFDWVNDDTLVDNLVNLNIKPIVEL
jgi:hypothetical protein